MRRISIKQGGETIAEFPLMFGVVGATLAPALAAMGAIVALGPTARSKSNELLHLLE